MEGNCSTRLVFLNKRKSPTPLWRKLIPNFTTLSLITLFFFSLFLNGDIRPLIDRGFFCDDTTIRYPFKQDTIGMKLLFFVSLIIPGLVIKICDTILKSKLNNLTEHNSRTPRKRRKVSGEIQDLNVEEEELIASSDEVKRRHLAINEDDSDYDVVSKNAERRVGDNNEDEEGEVNLFSRVPLVSVQGKTNTLDRGQRSSSIMPYETPFGGFHLFFFGFVATMLLTGIGKVAGGRLRPHFIQRCVPDVSCSTPENKNKYIEEFTCTNSQLRTRDIAYIRTSWPSGHAAIMFYSMLYMSIYLNTMIPAIVNLSSSKVKRRFDPLILYTMYVLMIALAGYIALTRVSDYHHHPLDVFSGSVIGALTAIALTKSLPMMRGRTN